jgi:hypothetical protein
MANRKTGRKVAKSRLRWDAESSRDQEEAVSRKVLISTIAIAAAVAVPVADAHTLSKSDAKRAAARVGTALARDLHGSAVYDCTRRSDHAFRCRISIVTLDGDVCVTVVRVAYRGEDARRPTRRVVSGLTCEPPELPSIL